MVRLIGRIPLEFGNRTSLDAFRTVAAFNVYGDMGDGFIHVHHLKDLATIGEEYEVDPIEDLRPVCPNCHAMLHRTVPAMSIEDLRAIFEKKSTQMERKSP